MEDFTAVDAALDSGYYQPSPDGLVIAAEKFWSLVSSLSELSHLRGLTEHC
ncbi:hypothetical protein H6F86_00300 [Phormidium sp. FACHB-592]|uniref:Uncharacterized protein n=1 Tax=Stenomitos frigidus AS-A4 TaxID=2933935 RepID=A0ABV0KTX6_9CYAN|nr:hypothetical protein [Phormidium sp. FACHB-592]MBD2072374.1 hypothetical protein [Phormidium sp. FACHB-592]